MTKSLLKKVGGFAVLFLILNPRPRVSDAQMREEMRGAPREAVVQKEVCFHAEQISIEQSEVLFNGTAVSMPQMHVLAQDQEYEVTLGDDVQGDYDRIFSKWQKIVQGAQKVCMQLNSIQELESLQGVPNGLWTIQILKSERGEWSSETTAAIELSSN